MEAPSSVLVDKQLRVPYGLHQPRGGLSALHATLLAAFPWDARVRGLDMVPMLRSGLAHTTSLGPWYLVFSRHPQANTNEEKYEEPRINLVVAHVSFMRVARTSMGPLSVTTQGPH